MIRQYATINARMKRGDIMPISDRAKENKTKYVIEYAKKTYKRIPLDVTHSQYAEIQTAAKAVGETVNGYIKEAIRRRIENQD